MQIFWACIPRAPNEQKNLFSFYFFSPVFDIQFMLGFDDSCGFEWQTEEEEDTRGHKATAPKTLGENTLGNARSRI